ncbi:MAG TPA: phage baseplate assembly protein V [Acidimicrobiales bacterium]|nr:phage baseplate assembly protein V [Acidimicrobiales bacterium]
MASGFGGRYQGSVVDDADPLGEHRLRVIVPEVWGTEAGAWERPSLPPGGAATPVIGDLVWVTFEGGDTDYPIWDNGAPPDPDAVPRDGHVGRYRALVADNLDPMEEHRLNVKIPEVLGDDTTAWAKAAPDLAATEAPLPEIGTEVWIEFESGDRNYPIWVGVA